MTYDVIDLFAGGGGWDQGFAQTSSTLSLLGIEYEANACETGKANGHKRLQQDIADLEPLHYGSTEWSGISGRKSTLKGLIASPPCPGFSSAGLGLGRKDLDLLVQGIGQIRMGADPDKIIADMKRFSHDDRSALTLEPLRWALALKPNWTVWEQVPAVLPIWEASAEALRADGYSVWVGKLGAEQFGVPQTRNRAILIASRTKTVSAPKPTHSKYYSRARDRLDRGVQKWVSMAEALDWGMTDRPSVTLTSKGFRWVEEEQRNQQFCGAGITSEQTAGQRPREMEEPAHTIAGKGTAAWKTWLKDEPQTRRVTVQEASMLQSFPEDYVWCGSKTSAHQQIGNAIPPLLAQRILEVVL